MIASTATQVAHRLKIPAVLLGLAGLGLTLAALDAKPEGKTEVKDAAATIVLDPAKQTRDAKGARAILEQYLKPGADHERITRSLRPRPAHFSVFFSRRIARNMYWIYNIDWNRERIQVRPKTGQTELILHSATVADLRKNRGIGKFPAGYRWLLDDLQPGHRIYVFTFARPGERLGRTYDGLVHVHDQWVLFPGAVERLKRSRHLRLSPALDDPRNWPRHHDQKRL